ncbi:hypothetical protein WMY93_031408 [Mugilogobius chulae]|uniref:C2H2-type domain-containing protein n=1 Tax=Mugilogobius chulae TaxID=88201 RepID=A0AAW0MG32_9GOBI
MEAVESGSEMWADTPRNKNDHEAPSPDELMSCKKDQSKKGVRVKRGRKPATKDQAGAYLPKSTAAQTFRTHRCPTCHRCFKMSSHLAEHLKLHFPDPQLQCSTCQRYFTSKNKLHIHQLRESGFKSHKCSLCSYSAVERNSLRRHFLSIHADKTDFSPELNFTCPVCSEGFRQSKSLKTHLKTHNVVKNSAQHFCIQEGCSFKSTLLTLIQHIAETHHFTPTQCKHHACTALFRTKTLMEEHFRNHQAYHCTDCDFACSNKKIFAQHRKQGHAGGEQFSCEFCDFKSFNSVEFESHVGHFHASEKIHKCSHCDFITSYKHGLKRHMLRHTGEKRHKCSVCDFRCRDESYLSRHMLTHSDSKNYMCSECGYVTKWKHYLAVHMRKHAGDMRYQCDLCGYRCHRADLLNSHKLRHQNKNLICEICAYSCKRKYELRQHMLSKHSETKLPPAVYKCKFCTYTSSYRQALRNHENCKHTKSKDSVSLFLHKRKTHGYVPGDKAWLENYALKEKEKNTSGNLANFYNNATKLRKHKLRLHDKKPTHFCTDCDFSGFSPDDIKRHKTSQISLAKHCKRVHLRSFTCKKCKYTCGSSHHMRVHQDERNYLCTECGYKCKWATQLKCHMTKHTGEKRFECPDCDYRTNRADALRSHRDTQHSSSRPFICEKCGKSFKTSAMLKTHQQQHSDSRPFTCGLCQKSFKWPAGLRHHFLSHTQQMPFCCTVCSYRAKQRFQVVRHLKKHHPEVAVEEGVQRDGEVGGLAIKDALEGRHRAKVKFIQAQKLRSILPTRAQHSVVVVGFYK